MYHNLEFNKDCTVDLEVSPKQPLEKLQIRQGSRLSAQVRPHVIETEDGLKEVADLFFSDGTATRSIPFEQFSFAD